MTESHSPTTGQMITTFTFILFGLLLGLAAMAEPSSLKSGALGFCSVLSFLGAARYKIQKLVALMRQRKS